MTTRKGVGIIIATITAATLAWGTPAAALASPVDGGRNTSAASAASTVEAVETVAPPDPRHMWDDAAAVDGSRVAAASPTWTSEDGVRTFRDGTGATYLSPAAKVIDVSSWNAVDWTTVAARGDIDGVVLRAGYGVDNVDTTFAANLQAVRELGIPYGVYWYSYAYDDAFAEAEGDSLAATLARYDVQADDLTLGVFYDLERFKAWEGHEPPTSPDEYEAIVDAFDAAMTAAGYPDTAVYSYTSYLNTALASPSIWARVSWVAQYGPIMEFSIPDDTRRFAWQYTSSGTVAGIDGNVDLSAFAAFRVGGFADVSTSTPHATDIAWLVFAGISTGWQEADGTVTFRGMDEVRRQDMAAFLYRLAGSPAYEADWSANPFRDVDRNTPHAKEILWLASTGVSEGWAEADGSRTFRGMDSVRRQDMAAFLRRLAAHLDADATSSGANPFRDVDAATPHAADILWLASNGVSEGWTESDGSRTFRGMDSVRRQDMAAFLHRMDTDVLTD